MSCEIIIRYARDEDLRHRMELVRNGYSDYFWDAFIYFLFQELTLEGIVLCAAVLFIFVGASVSTCLLLVPAAAVLVAVVVSCVHHAIGQKQAQSVSKEIFGLVAEVRGALLLAPPPNSTVPIRIQLEHNKDSNYSQVMGTISVSECWGPQNDGWLHALVVHPLWRGRSVGRALAGGAKRGAANAGLAVLHASTSALQNAARTALAAAGFSTVGAYERPLLGAALSLPVVRLHIDLPQP